MNFAGCSVRRLVSYVRQGPPRPAWSRGGCLSCGFGDGLRFPKGNSGSSRQASANAMVKFLGDCFREAVGFDWARATNGECRLGRFAACWEEDRQRLRPT